MARIVYSRLLRNAYGHLRYKKVVVSLPDSVASIIQEVASEFALDISALMGKRARKCAEARFEAMRRTRETIHICGRPPAYAQIGRWFGRDHTTVIAAIGDNKERLRAEKNERMRQARAA